MPDSFFDTPVLFIVFNRPETTQTAWQVLRQVQPTRLFIAADGPRSQVPADADRCAEVLRIVSEVDWDCQVQTYYREQNAGCKVAVSEAIGWFFEHEEEGIILEDDCLPSLSFFPYCAHLLAKYRHDTRVVHINGNNFNTKKMLDTPYSYHFVQFPQVWGWATWKRAWMRYDTTLRMLPDFDNFSFFRHIGISEKEFTLLRKKWWDVRDGTIDTWDYQWHFINFLERSWTIAPKQNLISNLGFNGNATHTLGSDPLKERLPIGEISFPLIDPPCLFTDELFDTSYRNLMVRDSLATKVKRKLFASRA